MRYFTDISLEYFGDSLGECRKLIPTFIPTWAGKTIVGKPLCGGFVNKVLVFHLAEDRSLQDALVFKIYGNVRNEAVADCSGIAYLFSSEAELIGMQVGRAAGCFPPVLAVFNNGIVYKYAQGRKLVIEDLENPDLVRAVARTAADLHTLDLQQLDILDKTGQRAQLEDELRYMPALRQMVAAAPRELDNPDWDTRYEEVRSQLTEIRSEMEYIDQLVNDLRCPWRFCHNDLHMNNILYDDATGKITIVDWDHFRINYTIYDGVQFFVQSQYAVIMDQTRPDLELTPMPKCWPEWQQAYSERFAQRTRENVSAGAIIATPTQSAPAASDTTGMERLHEEFCIFRILHHFYMVGVCLLMVNSPVLTTRGMDLTRPMIRAWHTYQTLRPQLEAHKKLHRQLTTD